MPLKLYNTLTRKKEIFKPIEAGKVGIYGCGPTVYSYQHIGNLRRYIFEDILIRALLLNNFKIKHIINVTDVGHLTSDADEGEDKIEKAAKKEKKTAQEISQHYFEVFHKDLKKLNFTEPDKWTWATEHIKEQIDLIKKLEEKRLIYKTSDGVYFDTSKFKDYAKFAKLNIEGLQAGKRIVIGEKKTKTDFALWKFSEKPGVRQQEWSSPWGIGFPGWHIECSAMSSKYLGEQYDIHTGGIDHINVHHTNEIAQSESAFGKKPWVKYWMHCNHLILKEGKMSKSSGDTIRLENLEEKGYSPMEFRYLCLLTHYQKKIEFDLNNLKSAQQAYQRLKNIISKLKGSKNKVNKKNIDMAKKQFIEFINDDLNTSRALSYLWEILRENRLNDSEKYKLALEFDEVFGLDLGKEEGVKIPTEVKKLVEERENARRKKEWVRADLLRKRIRDKGFVVEDVGEESKVKGV